MSIFHNLFPNPASNTITGSVAISGDLNVAGDINGSGEVNLTDAIVILNDGETGAGITPGPYCGLEFDRGTETNYRTVFDETDDTYKIGLVGALVPVQLGNVVTSTQIAYGAASGDRLTSSASFTFDSVNGNLNISGEPNPQIVITDTTNTVIGRIGSTDNGVFVGSNSDHFLSIQTNGLERVRVTNLGSVVISGATNIDDTTQATSTTIASLQTDGGLGVVEDSFFGGKIDVAGVGRFTGAVTIGAITLPNTDGTDGQVLTTDGAGAVGWEDSLTFPFQGPLGSIIYSFAGQTTSGMGYIGGDLILRYGGADKITIDGTATVFSGAVTSTGALTISDSTASGSAATGALIIVGGAGIGEALNVTGAGGFGGALTVGGAVSITDTTAGTSSATGSLIVGGSIGLAKDLVMDGAIKILAQSTPVTSAAGTYLYKNTSGNTILENTGGAIQFIDDGTTVAQIKSNVVNIFKTSTFSQDVEVNGDLSVGAYTAGEAFGVDGNAEIYGSVSAYNISGRNLIDNGDMSVQQRAIPTIVGADNKTLDRWIVSEVSAGSVTVTKDTDVPTVAELGAYIANSFDIDVITADTSIGASEFLSLFQVIEGYRLREIYQQSFTFSFWVKSNKTGTYCVSFSNSATDRSYVEEYTIDSADTWEKKTITVTATPSGGTWNFGTGVGLVARFALAAGSTYQTTSGSWATGNYLATSSQTNLLDSTSNYFKVTAIQLEKGELGTPFEVLSAEDNLMRCRRYFKTSYSPSVFPGTASAFGGNRHFVAFDTNSCGGSVDFSSSARTGGTLTLYSPSTGTSGQIQTFSEGSDIAVTATESSEKGIFLITTSGALTAGQGYQFHYTYDAEFV